MNIRFYRDLKLHSLSHMQKNRGSTPEDAESMLKAESELQFHLVGPWANDQRLIIIPCDK